MRIFPLIILLFLLPRLAWSNQVKIVGALQSGLMPEFSLSLSPSNPFCDDEKIVPAVVSTENGSYSIEANWNGGFCFYTKGTAALVIRHGEESATINVLFNKTEDGYTELHQVETLECAENDLGQFECQALQKDGGSIIGNNFSMNDSTYHINIVSDPFGN